MDKTASRLTTGELLCVLSTTPISIESIAADYDCTPEKVLDKIKVLRCDYSIHTGLLPGREGRHVWVSPFDWPAVERAALKYWHQYHPNE